MEEYIKDLKEKGVRYAVFDVDGTLSYTNTAYAYIFCMKKKINNQFLYFLWGAIFFITSPFWIVVDSIDRDIFQKLFIKKFNKFSFKELQEYFKSYFEEYVKGKFIDKSVELLEKFRAEGFEVIILSMSIQTLIDEYGKYFGVEAHSMTVNVKGNKCEVDLSDLKDFKLNFAKKFPKEELVVIADSKHDLPIFNYAKGGQIIVLKRYQKWMKDIKNGFLLYI